MKRSDQTGATCLSAVLLTLFLFASFGQATRFTTDPRPTVNGCSLTGPLPSLDDVFPSCVFKADFILAGGGTGALTAARTLLDRGFSVLVLEPGQYRDDDPNVYGSFNYQQVTHNYAAKYGIQLKSTVEPVLGVTYDVLMARFWGGSSNHNGEMYVKPSNQWFHQLEALMGPNWSASTMQGIFKQLEKYNRNGPIDPLRGTTGRLDVRRPDDGPATGAGSLPTFLANSIAGASGIPITADYNGANSFGSFARYDLFQKPTGDRSSSSTANFPTAVMFPNGTAVNPANQFRALFESTVVRLHYLGKRVIGVEYLRDGRTYHAFVNKEVILGGSLYSAQILQQSGVGPASLLQGLGIDVVVNNPNVGTHARNHPSVQLDFNFDSSLLPAFQANDPFALYMGGGFLPSWTSPGPVDPSQLLLPRQYELLWLSPFFPGDTIHLYIIKVQTQSEGLFQIQSKDPLQAPLYQDNFFTNSADLDDFASMLLRFQDTIVPYMHSQNSAFSGAWTPWASINDAKNYVTSFFQKSANNGFNFHYAGTNKMGTAPATSVVDSRGRVWGLKGLRVADTSIIPLNNVDGNTAAMAMAIGANVGRMAADDN